MLLKNSNSAVAPKSPWKLFTWFWKCYLKYDWHGSLSFSFMNSHWPKVTCWSRLSPTKNTVSEGSTLVCSVWICKRKQDRIWSSTDTKRMLKRCVLFPTCVISVQWMLSWQLGEPGFLRLGHSYITDACCPPLEHLTLRRAVPYKRPCRSTVFSARAARSGTRFPAGWSGHFSWPEFALTTPLQ